ncbi:MAG: ABC transporter ATP-binding protein [Methanoregula sp.]|jgi:oligopeptide/dipeptide ABC transporter ATP-binding protein
MTEQKTILEIKQLNSWFNVKNSIVKAVEDVNLSLAEGEILGIVGESGCGKSVLAKSIIGLLEPPGRIVAGSIAYKGRDLVGCPEKEYCKLRSSSISYLIQNPMSAFNPVFSIRQQLVKTILRQKGYSKAQASDYALELLAAVKIGNAKETGNYYPHQLSGGMLQRAAIALAIAGNPDILIADEPTTALDMSIQAEILALLKKLNRERHISMLIITHNFGVIWEICERVIVMYAGRIVEEASTADIYRNPRHPYTRALLNSILTMEERREICLPYLPGSVSREDSWGCNFAARCEKAKDNCRSEVPVLQEIEPGHFVCCHLQPARKT